jgi:hypothetical protein
VSDINSRFRAMAPDGTYGADLGTTLDDLRGLVFAPPHGYVFGAAACPMPPP